jgi:hypothetical protein
MSTEALVSLLQGPCSSLQVRSKEQQSKGDLVSHSCAFVEEADDVKTSETQSIPMEDYNAASHDNARNHDWQLPVATLGK